MSVTIHNAPKFNFSGIENRIPLLRKIAEFKVARLKVNLASGVGPNGRPFARVAPWTRAASISRGRGAKLTNIKPLMNTGQMRASIAPVSVTNNRAVIAGIGKQQDKINRMVNGIPGRMAVSQRRVKGLYSGIKISEKGNAYCRINTPVGWRTKRVTNGTISINPRPRPFMYFTQDDVRGMNDIVSRYVRKVAAR